MLPVRILLSLASVALVATATQELDQASFDALTKSGKNGMIKFFQPWCGHCTAMKPAWDEVAESVNDSAFLADVNCSDQEELCQANDVKGYPTIKVYKDGEVSDYSGGRTVEALTEYVETELSVPCNIATGDGCSDKAVKYAEKWKTKSADDAQKEIVRLTGMMSGSMIPDLKKWLRERLFILKSLVPGKDAKTAREESVDEL
jgi:protein disulfide-isomerase A6